MIIFVEEKHLEKCHTENDGIYIAVSSELLKYADWMGDSSMLIPPPDAVMHYIGDGNKEVFREEYYQYLSDPRIVMVLGLRIYQADNDNVFFCYSKMEKEMGYPKLLRKFIIDNLEIPKEFVVKYKDFDGKHVKMKPKAYNKFMEFMNETKKKCKEAFDVLS